MGAQLNGWCRILLLATALIGPLAHAQSTWTGAGTPSQSWSNPANWTGGVPNGPTAVAIFPPAGPYLVNVDIPVTLQSLQFNAGKELFGNAITFSAAGGQITVAAGMDPIFGIDLIFQGSASITTNAASTLEFNNLSGPGGYTQSGPGQVSVNNTLGLAGPVAVNGGFLELSVASGTSDLFVAAGAEVRPLTSTWGALSGAGTVFTAGSPLTFNQASDTTFSGTLSTNSAARITKNGSGKLVLSGTTSVSVASVNAGTLQVGDGLSGTFSNPQVEVAGTFIFNPAAGGSAFIPSLTGSGTFIVRSGTLSGPGGSTLGANADVVVEAGAYLAARLGTTGDVTIDGTWTNPGFSVVGSLAGSGTLTLDADLQLGGNHANTTFSGPINAGTGREIVKVGSGTLTLSNLITTTIPVRVMEGSVHSQGATFAGGLTMSSVGGTFSGYGTIPSGQTLSIGSSNTLAPRGGVIDLGGQITLNGPYVVRIDGPSLGAGYGRVASPGPFNMFPPLAGPLVLTGSYVPVVGDSFMIFENLTPSGSGGAFPFPGAAGTRFTLNGVPLEISYTGGTGNDWVLTVATQTVTSSSSGNGGISPSGPQVVLASANVPYLLTPVANYRVGSVTGTCPAGTLTGNTYTTGAITANCTVVANFVPDQFTVTPSAGANGSISPNTAQVVNNGATTQFAVSPNGTYDIDTVTGCGGSMTGPGTYTTGPITGDCTVSATFRIQTFTVTPVAGTGGAISPNTAQTVSHGASPMFTVTPDSGYRIDTVSGCGGSLAGNAFTVAAVTANCTVSASFVALIAQVIAFPQPVDQNTSITTLGITATGGASGNPVTFSSLTTGICTTGGTHGATVTLTGTPGICTIAANQAGDATHDAAPQVTRSFKVLRRFNVVLEGAQEYFVNGSPATGSAVVDVDVVDNMLAYSYTIADLTGTVTLARLHGPAARGTTNGVKIDLTGAPPADVVPYLEADEADILAGLWYLDFATSTYGGGEIRGQLDDLGAAPRQLLTVNRTGVGGGTVSSDSLSPGIACGATCAFSYPQGLALHLQATPDAGSFFAGWSGAGCSGTNLCAVTMSSDQAVSAQFGIIDTTPDAFTFTDVNPVGRGNTETSNTVTISGINAPAPISVTGGEYSIGCTATFTTAPSTISNGQTVCVRHSAAATSDTATNTTLTVGGVSDTFTTTTYKAYTVSVALAGTGSGMVTSAKITCPGDCSDVYDEGEPVFLSGTANAGSTFVGWSNGGASCTGTGLCVVITSATTTVTATFDLLDTTPDAFTFTDQVAVARSSVRTSNAVTITGIAAPAPISVTGGAYSIGCTATFVTTASTINNGDTVCVRHTSSAAHGAATNTILTVGGVSDTFTSTTLAGFTLTTIKAGTGTGAITGTGINCPGDCTEAFDPGTVVPLTATPTAGSAFTAWSGACTGSGACNVTMDAAKSVTATFTLTAVPAVTLGASAIDFGGQSMGTSSAPRTFTITNSGSATLTVSSVTDDSAQFSLTHDCTTVAAGASCAVTTVFSPATVAGALNVAIPAAGSITITSDAADSPHAVSLAGLGEKSLVTHYYRAILNRAPDQPGKDYWTGEAARLAGLGVNVNEAWFVMAGYFFNSAEYQSANKNDTQFVTDLYNTFFNRPPDAGGLGYWTGQISGGLPREVVLFSFMFSTEFRTFAEAIFGNTAARPEVDMVVDFFRGILNRLPDTASYNYWLGRIRAAQCAGAGPVYTEVDAISAAFIFNPEYGNRMRTNTQYVTDMYYSFLRRGGDIGGVQYWINELATNARDANNVRFNFLNSPEFGARVQAVIDAGCIP